jgi:Tfp pilus assembly protein PilO
MDQQLEGARMKYFETCRKAEDEVKGARAKYAFQLRAQIQEIEEEVGDLRKKIPIRTAEAQKLINELCDLVGEDEEDELEEKRGADARETDAGRDRSETAQTSNCVDPIF